MKPNPAFRSFKGDSPLGTSIRGRIPNLIFSCRPQQKTPRNLKIKIRNNKMHVLDEIPVISSNNANLQ